MKKEGKKLISYGLVLKGIIDKLSPRVIFNSPINRMSVLCANTVTYDSFSHEYGIERSILDSFEGDLTRNNLCLNLNSKLFIRIQRYFFLFQKGSLGCVILVVATRRSILFLLPLSAANFVQSIFVLHLRRFIYALYRKAELTALLTSLAYKRRT